MEVFELNVNYQHWNVSQKTAKRDIADLKQKGLIVEEIKLSPIYD